MAEAPEIPIEAEKAENSATGSVEDITQAKNIDLEVPTGFANIDSAGSDVDIREGGESKAGRADKIAVIVKKARRLIR